MFDMDPQHDEPVVVSGSSEPPGAKLPEHLTRVVDKTSRYWNGRWAQGHPNIIRSEDQTAQVTLTMLGRAMKALARWAKQGGALPTEAALDLKTAYEALDDVQWHLPQIMMWCVWAEYTQASWDHHVVWSAHFSEEEAQRWLPFWSAKLGTDAYVWHVGLHECSITNVRDPDATPEQFVT